MATPKNDMPNGNSDCDNGNKGKASPMGGTPGAVGQPIEVPADVFSLRPTPMPEYRTPGKPERR